MARRDRGNSPSSSQAARGSSIRVPGLLRLAVAVALAWQFSVAGLAAEPKVDVDILLAGGTLYDGSGSQGVEGDLAIRDGKIVAVGRFEAGRVGRRINCTRLIVAPGFIDLHTHCDSVATTDKLRPNVNYLTQGCTTVVTGNCGGGAVNVAEYFEKIDREGVGTNVIHLVPHGSVRSKAMGSENRAPKAEELQRMKDLVDRGMREGAWGMSTGLIYVPGMFAKTDEIIELAKVVAFHGGIYASHIRSEGSGLVDSIREAVEIGRAAGLPVHISHFKATGKANWHLIDDAIHSIEEARAGGLAVTADQYPYIATSTGLGPTLFPATQVPGGLKDFARRIQDDPEFARQVRQLVERRLGDSARIVIASCRKHPEWAGKSLDEIAGLLGVDAIEAGIRIQADGGASVVKFSLSEESVRRVMGIPWVATGSDGSSAVPSSGVRPHPRSFGTFPRKIGRYALRENVIPLAAAIRSATGLPADILKLSGRGYLRPDHVADVVVFDPETFVDAATFEEPQQYSTGVRYVFVAGQAAIDDGTLASELYGRAIRHGRQE